MADKTPVASTADEVRKVLAASKEPLTCKQIFDLCDTATTTTQIAGILHVELAAARVERSGDHGAYAYRINSEGRAIAEKPNALRSGRRRRMRGRGARKAAPLSEALEKAAEAKPARAKKSRAARAATAPAPAPAKTATASDDGAQRLAGAVLAHWPGSLNDMPADLRTRVDRTLSRGARAS